MADNEQIATMPLPEIEADKSESWVQLLPAGKFRLRDNRGVWEVRDMASVIAASQAAVDRGMPVDMDHALERKHQTEAPAAGWIEELAARDDGIWARIVWTPTGKAKIAGREYRFISPVILRNPDDNTVLSIQRAGLTNDPAITMKAICSAENDAPADKPMGEGEIVAMLREALGAPADMTVPELIRRARTIIATAATTRTDTAPAKELASSYMRLLAETHEGKVEAVLECARNAGKLIPALEDWAQELASRDLASFERWANSTPAFVSFDRTLAGRTPPTVDQGRFRGDTERAGVFRQLGLEE